MVKFSIAGKDYDMNDIKEVYKTVKTRFGNDFGELDLIFEVALNHQDRFPVININNDQTAEEYIERWVKSYCNAMNHLPSTRIAERKSSCTDPAIKVIVKTTRGLSETEAETGEVYHNLFMSAENIQGNLLEEYIASKVRSYGFLWCAGNVLTAIDFCNSNGTFLLQVKNKSNTENSSSNKIRSGTTIGKWYRLGTRTSNGVRLPVYRWEQLNAMINQYKTMGQDLPSCYMSEEEYQEFLKRKASENHSLITDQ